MNRVPVLRSLLAAVVSGSLLVSCGGWHMRGGELAALGIEHIDVRDSSAPTVAQQIRTRLNYSGISIARIGTRADATVLIGNEQFARRVLSIDSDTGKVREVEIGLQIEFELLDAAGQIVIPLQAMQWQRDFVFDEGALLGTAEQESLLRQELAADAATVILLRLEALRPAAAGAE